VAVKQDNRTYALIDLYALLYTDRYKKKPTINKYRDKWGFLDMIDSVGYERSVEITKYYFLLDKSAHPLNWLFNNFDKLDTELSARDADRQRRARLREQTARRMEDEN
jgi:hypothetical protein